MKHKLADIPIIDEATVTILGDPGVGIPHNYITISNLHFDLSVFDDKDRLSVLEEFRNNLMNTFRASYEANIQVLFDFEFLLE